MSHPLAQKHREIINNCENENNAKRSPSLGGYTNEKGDDVG